jgi:D-glycero-D-manno-heptose 1,7-bisphosphate phosphatase
MHAKMNQMLAHNGGRVDAVFFCPHEPDAQCQCRKPLPGLYLQISDRYGVDLKDVPTVGDSLRDLQAGAAAGCETHFVRTGKAGRLNDAQVAQLLQQVPGATAHKDLAAFAEFIIMRERRARAEARGETPLPPDSGPGELR